MAAEDYTGNTNVLGAAPAPGPAVPRATTRRRCRTPASRYDVYDVDAQRPHGADRARRALALQGRHLVHRRRPLRPRARRSPAAPALEADRRRGHRGPRLPQRRRHGARHRPARAPGRAGTSSSTTRSALRRTRSARPTRRRARATRDDPPGQNVELRDRLQRLPAVLARGLPADHASAADTDDDVATLPFKGAGAPFGTARVHAQRRRTRPTTRTTSTSFVTTSSILPTGDVPAVHSATRRSGSTGPPAFDPPEGTQYAYAQAADERLPAAAPHGRPDRRRPRPTLKFTDLLRHRAGLRLRVRRGAHRRPGRLDDAARHQRAHDRRRRAPAATIDWNTMHPFLQPLHSRTRRRATTRRAPRPARPARGTRPPATPAASRTGRST